MFGHFGICHSTVRQVASDALAGNRSVELFLFGGKNEVSDSCLVREIPVVVSTIYRIGECVNRKRCARRGERVLSHYFFTSKFSPHIIDGLVRLTP